MGSYFIESFKITKLWGYREDINLTFNNDVNVLIGPNGSGKTTVLTLLNSILSLDLSGLLNVNFEYAEIHLRDFKDSSVLRTIKVDAANRLLRLWLDEMEEEINTESIAVQRLIGHRMDVAEGDIIIRKRLRREDVRGRIITEDFYDELTDLVPIVWLPVSRSHRLPGTEYEEERYTRTEPLELVDLRLRELLRELFNYHSGLNTQLSERYKAFELEVLSVMLYSKELDHLNSILSLIPSFLPTETQKDQLMGAFEDAKLLNKQMQTRINDHFAAAEKAVKRISKNIDKDIGLDLEDVLVLPLIRRTEAMVECAARLEKDKEDIFHYIRRYEETVNSFLDDQSILNNKSVEVDGSGQLKIRLSSSLELDWHLLSSGEKQILILLTQAFLRIDEPVVYMADEPELSLHVTWQEKLLESLVTLGGQKQVIVATHSPDIVGKYQDKVIELGRES